MLNELERTATTNIKDGDESFDNLITLAWCAALRHKKDEAFKWLDKANEGAAFLYYREMTLPFWQTLQNDERFPKILAKMKEKIDYQRKLIEQMEKEKDGN